MNYGLKNLVFGQMKSRLSTVREIPKRTTFFHLVMVIGLLTSSLWGCASQNTMMASSKDNPYRKIIEQQKSRGDFENSSLKKLPEMTNSEHEKLGDAYFRQGRFELAFLQYEKALRLDPGQSRIHYKRGLLFLSRKLNKEAMEEFREVLNKEPNHALAHEGMGQALFKMGRHEEAEKQLRQALKLDSKLWQAHNFLGIIHDYKERPEQAAQEYRSAIALKGNEALLHNNLGVSYTLMGDYEKAVTAFAQALRAGKPDSRIYNNLGLALSKQGRYEEALEAFTRAGSEPQAYNNLGCVYLHQGEYENAIFSFERAIELKHSFYTKANENLQVAQMAFQSGISHEPKPQPSTRQTPSPKQDKVDKTAQREPFPASTILIRETDVREQSLH